VGRGNAPLRQEILDAIAAVIDSGRFLHGPDVAALESEIASRTGCRHAIACASGSDALLLALMALGVGPGDEVIVPSFTFFATASAAWRLGARPVFAEIDPRSFNLDPQRLRESITPRTKAIIPVHLFGQSAEMTEILELAGQHGVPVIEDSAQAIGATHHGRPVGSIGLLAAFSFYPTKNLGGFGDGGMVTTDRDDLAERVRLFAAHGMNPRYCHRVVGINSRLDTIQAAVLRVKLRHLEDWTARRSANAERYAELFADQAGHRLTLPSASEQHRHVWNQYTIRVPGGLRDPLREQLQRQGIGSEIYYPVPLHQQDCFKTLEPPRMPLRETEAASNEVLSLPIYPELTRGEQDRVVDCIRQFLAGTATQTRAA
jgi:dTDP-4-amino-4,6-dideoxygalactose transaminase